MGTEIQYKCEKYGFIINDYDLNYFVDEETNYVIEHASGMLTFDMGGRSKIKGIIILSFCQDCSSEVHFYYNENESYVKEIKSSLKQDEKDFKKVLDKKYPYRTISSVLKGVIESKNKSYGECPKCGKNIPLIKESENKCPKCCEKLYVSILALYD